jgi:hypothetical protein
VCVHWGAHELYVYQPGTRGSLREIPSSSEFKCSVLPLQVFENLNEYEHGLLLGIQLHAHKNK